VSSGVLPADTVTYDRELTFADLSPNDRAARVVRRERWFHDAMVTVDQCSLVFVDPDNGLRHDGRAVPSYRDAAEKHVYLSEIGQLLERGQSVVASHHADPSESIPAQAMAEMDDVHEGARCGAAALGASSARDDADVRRDPRRRAPIGSRGAPRRAPVVELGRRTPLRPVAQGRGHRLTPGRSVGDEPDAERSSTTGSASIVDSGVSDCTSSSAPASMLVADMSPSSAAVDHTRPGRRVGRFIRMNIVAG
jgi:hypothetical protein